jgi:hypothetical protein
MRDLNCVYSSSFIVLILSAKAKLRIPPIGPKCRARFIHIILPIPNGVKMNFRVNTTKRIGQVKNRTVPNKAPPKIIFKVVFIFNVVIERKTSDLFFYFKKNEKNEKDDFRWCVLLDYSSVCFGVVESFCLGSIISINLRPSKPSMAFPLPFPPMSTSGISLTFPLESSSVIL